MMSTRARRLALGALLALGLLYFVLKDLQLQTLWTALRSASPFYLLAVLAVTVVTYAARAWRWGGLLSPLARVPFLDLFSATWVGFMSGLVIPRAGEIVRPYLVARRHPVDTSAAFASIIIERLVDLITVVALFALYLYVLPMPAAQSQGPVLDLLRAGALGAAGVAIGVLGVLILFHVKAERALELSERALRWLPARLAAPVAGALRSFSKGLAVLRAPAGHLLGIMAQSLLVWLAIGATIYFNNRAFGLDLPFHSAFLIVGFLTVGVAVPTPGMVGGFHAAYLIALTQVYGISKETAAAAAITAHALTNLPVLILGLAFLGREGLTVRTMAKVADQEERRTP
ncbi:MAG TPA: lysylphosphatidylglycerol synthase transmembrane domain-containing protein [Vicinamibacteria bacterium]|nr:lysylphosphatidylglycerol synthase transmembrane domain-containing protein [Vicinamibacteria bacterium]